MSNQTSNVAVFKELASSAPLLCASKIIDITGCQTDCAMQSSGAQQAYAQARTNATPRTTRIARQRSELDDTLAEVQEESPAREIGVIMKGT